MNGTGLPEQLPGFDDPIGMLRACHEQMVAHLELLEGLLAQPDAAVAQQVARYFSTSAVQHHRDEEEDLFPLLNRQSMKLAELIFLLRKQHGELDRLWDAIAPALKKLPPDGLDTDTRSAISAYCELCREHIQRENRDFLPVATSSLSHEQLGSIGEAMAARRGVHYSAL